MKSYEALQRAIKGKTVEFAKRLGLSTILINKWQEPHTDFTDSGAYNPLDRLEIIIEASLNNGVKHDDALAPIYYLAEKFNLCVVPIPKCACLEDLSKELMETIKEFGHLATAASESMLDGWISKGELKRIEEEGYDLIRHATAFIHKAKEVTK